ncbi:MAG: RNA polymerase sigma factor [Flavobacteriaceae bacterium]
MASVLFKNETRNSVSRTSLSEMTDEQVMAKVAQGDLGMLKILFERHHKHIYNFLFKMSGDKMLSEDLTQEVFYKVIKYRSSYNNGKFVSWLFTIARNGMTSHFRSHKQQHHLELTEVADTVSDPIEEEDHSLLQRALNRLETSDRELIVLNRFQKIPYGEIAEMIGSTEGAVKTKACRALKKMRKMYLESM